MLYRASFPINLEPVADARLHDGTVIRVEHHGRQLRVLLEPRQRDLVQLQASEIGVVVVIFQDVAMVSVTHPEGMLYSSLLQSGRLDQFCYFEFANWFQPGDDWDPHMAACRLELVASTYTLAGPMVIDS